ncbi:GNAT family N-acetyltransferase [Paractinoplanes brasiliensis]|uniref:Acetyltransferase (GNAT) family protein n=1 Tax=Paractinoplanes brasiliensis TaxID=52695 RepID=A0A4R6JT90_9ACTN|nr:GNAT family N-acetyltransferase [Actinoplanes brasiliensis]TDO39943.1 acetyltransferase (GNAT) family protein [Actinoplanes brasiliensis]GID31565.1 GNAT family N-acetyltransferase [Actinoplanes brasiliensis]
MRVSAGPLQTPEIAYDIAAATAHHDCPDIPFQSRENYLKILDNPPPAVTFERHLGYLDGEPVGLLVLEFPQLDNLDVVWAELLVLPGHRRQGVGRALLDVAAERAAAHNRKHIQASTVDRHPDGRAFAEAAGAKPGLAEIRSRLDVTALDPTLLAGLRAEAEKHAAGYTLRSWLGVPPDDLIDGVAYLEGRLNADAPSGDLTLEPEKMDAARIRDGELARQKRGRLSYQTGALLGDRLAAWTWINVDLGHPSHAWQSTTIVDPGHRGHRLGLLVKLENLDFVHGHRPALEAIDTFNAAENTYMLKVNRAMGFRAVDDWIEWQKDL